MTLTGKIKTIVVEKGFFFIKAPDGVEYFAHRSALIGGVAIQQIRVDDEVEFLPTTSPKGPRAESVMVKRLQDEQRSALDHLFR